MRIIGSLMDNDSVFGRIMTRCGILIAANLLFIVCSLPVVTAGAAYAALYFTLFSCLRKKTVNPFSTFWRGLKDNWKQGTLCFLGMLLIEILVILEISWCRQFEGVMRMFRYPLAAVGIALLILACYVFPVMAAFRVSLRQLFADSVYFAVRRPAQTLLMLFLNIAPLAWTFYDRRNLPTYAFIWVLCGFSVITMCNASMLLKAFSPHLKSAETEENADADAGRGRDAQGREPVQKSEREILSEMKKLGM